jgi:hypothetical protein
MVDSEFEQLGHKPHDRGYAELEHNAAVVCYLLSDASEQLSGQVLRVSRGYLSVMAHPLIAEPRVEMAEWTVAELATALRAKLAGHLQPLGDVLAEVSNSRVLD